jgi:hypothetical protein
MARIALAAKARTVELGHLGPGRPQRAARHFLPLASFLSLSPFGGVPRIPSGLLGHRERKDARGRTEVLVGLDGRVG